MANTQSPFGFSAQGRTPGSPAYDAARIKRSVASNNSNKIFKGDLVNQLTTGYVDVAAASGSAGTALGIADEFEYLSTSLQRRVWSNYWPGADATGDVTIWVIVDPRAQFVVQSTGSAAVGFADIGKNIDISTGTAGNTTTQTSGMAVNQGSLSTSDATLPFRVIGLASQQYPTGDVGVIPNIDDTVPYNNVIVTFNDAAFNTLTPVQ
ncbi:MAG: hypothetical protein KGL39_04515 [Patescibacteria group bacterium]|nr:hypothetical protein [Patescibacteria group bacterium]